MSNIEIASLQAQVAALKAECLELTSEIERLDTGKAVTGRAGKP